MLKHNDIFVDCNRSNQGLDYLLQAKQTIRKAKQYMQAAGIVDSDGKTGLETILDEINTFIERHKYY